MTTAELNTLSHCYQRGWAFTPLDGKIPIRRGWQSEPRVPFESLLTHDGNIGLRTGTVSGVVVVDVDDLDALENLPGPLPHTVTVETSHGRHYYYAYDKPLPNSAGKLAPRVDVRGDGGQVVFPGSIHPVTGAVYTFSASPETTYLAKLPGWIATAERPVARSLPYAATALMREALAVKLAPEGARNDRLNRAAFNLGTLISAGALDETRVLCDLYDAARVAGLPDSEIAATVNSGLSAGKSQPRNVLPFVQPVEVPVRTPVDVCTWNDDAPVMSWLFDGWMPRGVLSGLFAQGASGKGFLIQTLSMSLALGRSLLASFQPTGAYPVLWIGSEDGPDELHRRAKRISQAYRLSSDDIQAVAQNLTIYAGAGFSLLTEAGETADLEWLRQEISTRKPALIILDPLAHFHSLDENANPAMAGLLSTLKSIAPEATILLSHHVAKARQNDNDSSAGRGASSVRDHMRCVLSMTPLTESEVQSLGVSNPHMFVRLDLTKANYSPRAAKPLYFKRGTDEVGGVLFELDAEAVAAELQHDQNSGVALALARAIGDNPDNVTRRDIEKKLKAAHDIHEALYGLKGDVTLRQTEDAMDYAIKSGIINIVRVITDGKSRSVPRANLEFEDCE